MTKPISKRKKARSFSGCKCCKQAKRKCPEERPQCSICEKLGLKCEYDLNFLFRCETVDFDGHVSKAARITRPAPLNRDVPRTETHADQLSSPQKFIKYEFIDESASLLLSPQDRPISPISRSTESPNPAFSLLLEAANAKRTSTHLGYVITPPQSPNELAFNPLEKIMPPETKSTRGSLEFILN